jgi:hypothetical protein
MRSDLDGVLSGSMIYTGSGRTSLHQVFDGLRYQHSTHVVGVTSE